MMPGVKGKKTPEEMRAEMERQKREMVAKKQVCGWDCYRQKGGRVKHARVCSS